MDSLLLDELEVLKSIYGEENITISPTSSLSNLLLMINFPKFIIKITIPIPEYPISKSPHSIQIQLKNNEILSSKQRQMKELILIQIEKIMIENSGNELLFPVIEHIRTEFESNICNHINIGDIDASDQGPNNDDVNSNQDFDFELGTSIASRRQENGNSVNISSSSSSLSPPFSSSMPVHIIHGELTMERKSSFMSHFAIVQSMEEVLYFRSIVLSDKKVAAATHNIFAYRFLCPKTGVLYHDYDDDGETAAGGRLAELLRLMGIAGNSSNKKPGGDSVDVGREGRKGEEEGGEGGGGGVAVIVSRWFGGTLLGPDRFKLICNSARNLLELHNIVNSSKNHNNYINNSNSINALTKGNKASKR